MKGRADASNLRRFAKLLRKLPVEVSHEVAKRAAPVLSSMAQREYKSGVTVYEDPRPTGKHGALDLWVSGDAYSGVTFKAIGTIMRCVLSVPYTKYLIGKYRVLPMGDIPFTWAEKLNAILRDVVPGKLNA